MILFSTTQYFFCSVSIFLKRVNFTGGIVTCPEFSSRSWYTGTCKLYVQLPKLVISSHPSLRTCKMQIWLSKLVSSSYYGPVICNLHIQLPKVALLYHSSLSTPPPPRTALSSLQPHRTYLPHLHSRFIVLALPPRACLPMLLHCWCGAAHHVATLGPGMLASHRHAMRYTRATMLQRWPYLCRGKRGRL
jgi:hypothetical protein